MKKLRFLLLVMLPVFFTAAGFAGTTDHGEIAGLSTDGRYAEIMVSGIEDGSGFYYIKLQVLDIQKNRFVGKKISMKQDDSGTPESVKRKAQSQSERNRRKYGIRKSLKPVKVRVTGNDVEKTFVINGRKHVVKIDENESGTKCNSMAGMIQAKGFRLSLDGRVIDGVSSPSGSIGCAFAYKIESVYNYMGHVIILYSAQTPGFEGPDTTALFSSAPLK